jgi:UDP-glucuronate 4-epimerase
MMEMDVSGTTTGGRSKEVAQKHGRELAFHEIDLCQFGVEFPVDKSVDSVIHLAAKAGVRPSIDNPDGYIQANIVGTMRLLDWCRLSEVSEFVFGSSSSVYGDDSPVPFSEDARCDRPISPYAATKRAGELLCVNYSHLYQFKIACLRFFTVYGPRQRPDLAIRKFCSLISKGQAITLFGDGSTERDYTYCTDIVRGVMGARSWLQAQEPGTFDIFNLGGSRTTSLKQLVQYIEDAIGKKAVINWQPNQPGDVFRTFANTAKAQQALGYEPQVPIDKGIAQFVEWFRSNE